MNGGAFFGSRGLFDDDPFVALLGGFGDVAAPPDSVPLRILGLDELPATHDAVKTAFRARVMAAHPDLAAYTIPDVRKAAEAAVAGAQDVQELVWARDILLRKIPEPVTANESTTAHLNNRNAFVVRDAQCEGCGITRLGGWWVPRRHRGHTLCFACQHQRDNRIQRERRRQARAGKPCVACGQPFTPPRADGRYCSGACRQRAYRRRKAGAS